MTKSFYGPRTVAALGVLVFVTATAASAASADATFAKKAAMGGMGEVALAKLAMQNGGSPAVKMFAQKMITDHGKANMKLMSIAQQEGMTLPTSLDPASAAMQRKLASLHGAAFDHAYLQGQMTAHNAVATLMQTEVADGKDPALVSFAKATLPTVEAHLALDKSDLAKMGSMTSGSSM